MATLVKLGRRLEGAEITLVHAEGKLHIGPTAVSSNWQDLSPEPLETHLGADWVDVLRLYTNHGVTKVVGSGLRKKLERALVELDKRIQRASTPLLEIGVKSEEIRGIAVAALAKNMERSSPGSTESGGELAEELPQVLRLVDALNQATGVSATVQYMAAVFKYQLEQLAHGDWSRARGLFEILPEGNSAGSYYRIEVTDKLVDIACRGSTGAEYRCVTSSAGDRRSSRPEPLASRYPESTRTFALLAGGLMRADPEALRIITDEAVNWFKNPKVCVTLVVNGEIFS